MSEEDDMGLLREMWVPRAQQRQWAQFAAKEPIYVSRREGMSLSAGLKAMAEWQIAQTRLAQRLIQQQYERAKADAERQKRRR